MISFEKFFEELNDSVFLMSEKGSLFMSYSHSEYEIEIFRYLPCSNEWKHFGKFEYWKDVYQYFFDQKIRLRIAKKHAVNSFMWDVANMFVKSSYSPDEADEFIKSTEYVQGKGFLPDVEGFENFLAVYKRGMTEINEHVETGKYASEVIREKVRDIENLN